MLLSQLWWADVVDEITFVTASFLLHRFQTSSTKVSVNFYSFSQLELTNCVHGSQLRRSLLSVWMIDRSVPTVLTEFVPIIHMPHHSSRPPLSCLSAQLHTFPPSHTDYTSPPPWTRCLPPPLCTWAWGWRCECGAASISWAAVLCSCSFTCIQMTSSRLDHL